MEDRGFSAKVVEDSTAAQGNPWGGNKRLVTLQLRYPRFIHSEFMTHRVFSRNAMSSRAVPVAKMIEQVRTDPAMPIYWGKNEPGMQARVECNELVSLMSLGSGKKLVSGWYYRETAWREAAAMACSVAEAFNRAGYHKQIVNRLLEPWQWMHTVMTATEWSNFFMLRCHKDAMPEMELLATLMRSAIEGSASSVLVPGEWHLPYVSTDERARLEPPTTVQLSTARCARVSYLTHDGQAPVVEKDQELYNRLVVAQPIHASPAEHQATPDRWSYATSMDSNGHWDEPGLHGNLTGWVQHRKLVERGAALAKAKHPMAVEASV